MRMSEEERKRRAEWKPPAIVGAWLAVRRVGMSQRIEFRRDGQRLHDAAEFPGLWQELLDLTAQPDRDSPISGEYVTTPASVPLLMAALGWQFPAFYTLSVQLSKTLGWEADIKCKVVSVMSRLKDPPPTTPLSETMSTLKNLCPCRASVKTLRTPAYTPQK